MLEAVQTLVDASQGGGNAAATAGNATESSGDGAGTLDLSGSRDFLTREAAEEALAAMLVENAALRKVRCRCIGHIAHLLQQPHTMATGFIICMGVDPALRQLHPSRIRSCNLV